MSTTPPTLTESDMLRRIEEIQKGYYNANSKNRFFKNRQKMDIAQQVCAELDYEKIIPLTIYVLPNTNKVFFNYPIFKTFGMPDNYAYCQSYLQDLISSQVLCNYPSFEIHINLSSFTISAAHRYFEAIKSLFEETTQMTEQMDRLVVYHTPAVVEQIRGILHPIIKHIIPRIQYFSKQESDAKLQELHNMTSTSSSSSSST